MVPGPGSYTTTNEIMRNGLSIGLGRDV